MQSGEVYAKSAKSQKRKKCVVWSAVGGYSGPWITLDSYGLLGGGHGHFDQ